MSHISYHVIFNPSLIKNLYLIAPRTTKYTFWSFLPLNLFYQFKRVYNVYFLIAALSTLSGLSALSPITQILPVILVLGVAAIKDAIEDLARYNQVFISSSYNLHSFSLSY